MQSEEERIKRSALIQTALICMATELGLVLFLCVVLGSFAEAAFTSIFYFGPASLWLAPPLYRYLLRASQ